jgi:hypothetical protein
MTTIDLVNQVFDKYYHNNFLPSAIGGSPETTIVRLFIAINNAIQTEIDKSEVTKIWLDPQNVTWYTRLLPEFLTVPKFPGETDESYLQRTLDMVEAQKFGGNSSKTIKFVIYALIQNAINDPDADITIVSSSSFNEWKDQAESEDARWGEGFLWADTSETLTGTIKISIQFLTLGLDTDPLTYDYWAKSQNYTKIQDIVNLFKTPGITFELELLSP